MMILFSVNINCACKKLGIVLLGALCWTASKASQIQHLLYVDFLKDTTCVLIIFPIEYASK